MLLQWNNRVAQVQQRFDNFPDPASREVMNQIVGMMQSNPVLISLVVWIMFALIGVGAASLGGVIGVAIFEKRKGQPYPPQPPLSSGGYPPVGYNPPVPPLGDIPAPQPPYGSSDPDQT
jgi:hypothetical protein